MAKSPDKKSNNNNAADSDPNAANNSRKKLVMLAALILVVIAVSVGGTLALVKTFGTPPPAAEAVNTDLAGGTNAVGKQPAIYYPLQPVFIVNFESRGRQRFLQAELNLMVRDEAVISALELHMPAIRNSLVMLFSGQVYEDLQTAEGKELLRQQALLKVQEVLNQEIGKPGIEQVLFTNFVMQ